MLMQIINSPNKDPQPSHLLKQQYTFSRTTICLLFLKNTFLKQ